MNDNYFADVVKKRIAFSNIKHNDNQPLHIAFGISSGFVRPAGVTMTSIMENNKNEAIVFHIFIDDVSEPEQQRLKEFAVRYAVDVYIYEIDNSVFAGLNTEQFTAAAYYRFAIPAELSRYTDRCLYLDADICCKSSLAELKKLDLHDKIACVVEDHKLSEDTIEHLNMRGAAYFNTGVMYINLTEWQKTDVSGQCMELLKTRSYEFRCFDQDALNIVLEDKIIYIAKKFNFMCDLSQKRFSNISAVPQDTVFIHYIGYNKPWHLWCYYPLAEYFRHYSSISSWQGCPLDAEPKKYRQMRMFAKYYWRSGQLLKCCLWLWKSLVGKWRK